MNVQTKNTDAGEEARAKTQPLLDLLDRIDEIVSAFGDDDLIAVRGDLGHSLMVATSPKLGVKLEMVHQIVASEMRGRWEKERDRLTQSSPFYRFYGKDDDFPF